MREMIRCPCEPQTRRSLPRVAQIPSGRTIHLSCIDTLLPDITLRGDRRDDASPMSHA